MAFSISLIIVIITVLISLGAFNNKKIYYDLIFHPPVVSRHGQWYRFFSHGLIHADGPHLIFNMLALFLFGQGVEREFQLGFGQYGKLIYLLMYLIALPVAILPTYFKKSLQSVVLQPRCVRRRVCGAVCCIVADANGACGLFPASPHHSWLYFRSTLSGDFRLAPQKRA